MEAGLDAIWKGLAMGLLLALSVGPVIFKVINHSISNGTAGGFSFVIGVWISDLLMIVLSNVFSELVTQLLDFKEILGSVGSLLLIGMGAYYLFFKKVHLNPEDIAMPALKSSDHAKIAAQGFLLNTFNPAVMAFWLTAATTIAINHTFMERCIIFLTALLFNIGADSLKVKLAGKLRKKLNMKNIRVINKISGLILLIFGTVLLIGILFIVK